MPTTALLARPRLLFLLPVFDDWESLGVVLGRIDAMLAERGLEGRVLVVDDGSVEPRPASLAANVRALRAVDVLVLRRNVGHQRAIALGLAFAHAESAADAVVVMDGDGEDRPEDVPGLLERFAAHGGLKVVFAERRKRLEGLGFRVGYRAYVLLHRLLTGMRVRVGNFSVVPWQRLSTLVAVADLWNHFAAAVFVSKIPFDMVPTGRGARIAGRSRLRFVDLAVHGLSAISVFAEIAAVRTMVATLVLAVAVGAVLVWLGLAQEVGGRDAPGSLTLAAALLAFAVLQLGSIIASFVFFVLRSRNQLGFLPIRDYRYFVASVERIAEPR